MSGKQAPSITDLKRKMIDKLTIKEEKKKLKRNK